jgi:hypothetical protein
MTMMKMTPWWPRRLGVEVGEGDGGGDVRQWVFPPLRALENQTPFTVRSSK